jgi:hypothetical protein
MVAEEAEAAGGYAQRCLVFEPRRRVKQPRHFLGAEYDRQLARRMDKGRVFDDVMALERDPEEEPQRRHSVIDNGGCAPLCARCSWKRRTSSKLAVSGERPRNTAKSLIVRM